MKAIHLIQVMTILILSMRFTIEQAALPIPRSMSFIIPVTAVTSKIGIDTSGAEVDNNIDWFIIDEESRWTTDEAEILQGILKNSLDTLASNGIDGMTLLDGYRFRRQAGEYVGDIEGRMGIIDHNLREIALSDMAFTVQGGFAIYHELGHAVDYQLDRQLSEGFHRYTGGPEISEDGEQWQTVDNYWLRSQGRYDREEAAADAFAVLVMSHAGIERPIFANQPLTTDYNGISAAAALALQTID